MEEICIYLLLVAEQNNISIVWTKQLHEYTPPVCSLKSRRVLMNENWHDKTEIPFQLAHEIAHIIHGDSSDLSFYHASFTGKESVEYKANVGAVRLLISVFYQNIAVDRVDWLKFMRIFRIPSYLTDVTIEELKKYYGSGFLIY